MAKRKFYKQKNRLRRDFRPAESRNLKGDSGKHGHESQKVKQTLLHIYCDEILLLENFVVIHTSCRNLVGDVCDRKVVVGIVCIQMKRVGYSHVL